MTRTASAKLSEMIMQAAADNGYVVRNDYSGRAMYGDRCFGIDTDGKVPTEVIFWVARECVDQLGTEDEPEYVLDDLETMFSYMRYDSMGLGMIYYFPGWQLDEDVVAGYVSSEEEEEW